eukprot:GEMP01023192.1.p1 GENE.GEMP01023192.1~~GEMP01023192.1.p1  ORF type:complete len:272 (+),score=27.22 GEMP01023192.1:1348-2163(+)
MREFDHQCARDDSCIWSEMRQECREKVYCEDHIQNGDEEGVDCGGSCPLPCTCLWRHSNGCGASVALAPYYNQNCDVLIPSNAAGYCDCGNGYDHMNSVRCVHEPFTCRTVCEAVRCMYGFDTTCSACKQDGETCIVPGCLNEVYPTPGCGMLFGSCDAQRRCRAWPGEGNWSPSSARGSSDDYCRDFYTSCAEMIDWCHVQKFAAGCPRTCKTCAERGITLTRNVHGSRTKRFKAPNESNVIRIIPPRCWLCSVNHSTPASRERVRTSPK